MEKLNTYRVTYLETRTYYIDVNASDDDHAQEVAQAIIDLGVVDLQENESYSEGYQYDSCEAIDYDSEASTISKPTPDPRFNTLGQARG